MDQGDEVRIKGLAGVATVNAILPNGDFTVTDAEGTVHGPFTVDCLEAEAPEAP